MKKSSILLALMTLSPAAFSQSYSGTVGDLNTIFDPPANIQGTICSYTSGDGNEHSFQACSNGVAAARWMAEKYAQRTGKYLGCIDGLQQGIYDGFRAGVNPTQAMIKNAEAYVANSVMQSAVDRAALRADKHADTESADEIISRYRKVVGVKNSRGQQVLPNKTPNMPVITFEGFSNGYENDMVGSGFDKLKKEGLVSSSDDISFKFKMLEASNFVKDNPKSPCSIDDTIFGRRNMPGFSWYDLFRASRVRDFQEYGWNNASWAWDIYDRDERNIDHYQNYDGIRNLEKTVTETTPITETRLKRDANGQVIPVMVTNAAGESVPKLDENGHQVYETEEIITGYNTETKRVKLTNEDVKALQSIYRKAFVDSYGRYYAKKYASLKYHEEGLSRYESGVTTGRLVGQKVAAHLAKKNAYDTRYKSVSKAKYAELAEKKYLDSFNRLISIFENNPVVELVSAYIDGTTNDNIYRPGEQLTGTFTVKNLGEVARPVTMRLSSTEHVIGSQSGHVFTPAALDSTTTETGVIGQISNDSRAREYVTLRMNLDNPSNLNEVASALNVSKSQGITLRDYAEITQVSASSDVLRGKVDLTVKIENPSSVETPALPVVSVEAAGERATKNMFKIGAESEQSVLISFSNLDPLELINNGGFRYSAKVQLGDKITDISPEKSKGLREDSDTLIAKYFDGIINGKLTNYGNSSKEDRINSLIQIIEKKVDYGISGLKTMWKRQHEVDRTIIGTLQAVYKASKASRTLTSEGQRVYDELTDMLARKVNNRGSSRVRGRDKFYLRALKVMSKKVSTNWKKYRD